MAANNHHFNPKYQHPALPPEDITVKVFVSVFNFQISVNVLHSAPFPNGITHLVLIIIPFNLFSIYVAKFLNIFHIVNIALFIFLYFCVLFHFFFYTLYILIIIHACYL